ncbi:PLP-dependent aminotransferase family protein [Clostridium sp. MSJ-4]|uniref:PLP-dependent aminotransferase family protein n=1 Tax=Clostridium simiarum TaxID=2841506 RepID=A0ABS6EXN3_9CLOT|nr:PLP-dependent aminotransferase family protein [Clostridium simiarum]MBU5590986.1 PLP-dependent aminotransferase family protein [Clostridium simiarum]
MKRFCITFVEDFPKYKQLARHIKKLIDKDLIKDGEKLPPIRVLAKYLNVNNVTIVNAYKKLQQEGYAVLKMGSGTYAKRREVIKAFKKEYSETFKRISSREMKENIDFTGETTSSDYFPLKQFKEVLNQVIDRDGAEALIYQEALGFQGLRQSINKYFWRGSLEEDDILIVSGAQQGIDIASKALINVNDNVIVERPTYSGALTVFNWRRANIFQVDMLQDGADLESFEEVVKKNKIKCFYTMSYFQNPTGATYSYEKKKFILDLAEKYNFYIIEDDYLSELIFDKNIKYESFKSMDEKDRVIYIKSFSKIFLPGIRIGYVISPRKFKEIIQNSKVNTDISTSSLMQRALDLYINKGYWEDHIKLLKDNYEDRYIFMRDYMEYKIKHKVEFHPPGGGLSFFLKIRENYNLNCRELFFKAKEKAVFITPGVIFYKNPMDGDKYFRIGYSQTDKDKIVRGIDILEQIIV